MTPLVVVEPVQSHEQTVIFLHGRGMTGQEMRQDLLDMVGSTGESLRRRLHCTKWVFPTAAKSMATRFQEMQHQWFDIYSIEEPETQQDLQNPGLRDSILAIHSIIDRESTIIGSANVILAGLSQGAAVGIHALLSWQSRLGGFIAVCSWMPFRDQMQQLLSGSNDVALAALEEFYSTTLQLPLQSNVMTLAEKLPVGGFLVCHCDDDHIVDAKLGQELSMVLSQLDCSVKWRLYNGGGHWIKDPEGVDDIESFVDDCAAIAAADL